MVYRYIGIKVYIQWVAIRIEYASSIRLSRFPFPEHFDLPSVIEQRSFPTLHYHPIRSSITARFPALRKQTLITIRRLAERDGTLLVTDHVHQPDLTLCQLCVFSLHSAGAFIQFMRE